MSARICDQTSARVCEQTSTQVRMRADKCVSM